MEPLCELSVVGLVLFVVEFCELLQRKTRVLCCLFHGEQMVPNHFGSVADLTFPNSFIQDALTVRAPVVEHLLVVGGDGTVVDDR